jgi:RNA polymerase sigma-70 factor (ECF subfamily)
MPKQTDELIPTRASLIARLQDWQDRSSWQEFFDTYWKLIYGVARKAGLTDAEAQDVVMETMASVAKHMPTFKYDPARGSFKAWMLNKTRWLIIDHLRKRALLLADRRVPSSTTTGTGTVEKVVDAKIKSVTEVFEAEWAKKLMEAAIANVKRRVDPQKYQMFDFYVNKEWPPEKVGARFGVSVDQVYAAKHRITEMIKAEVKRLKQETI